MTEATRPARWLVFLLIFGLYLSLRGYHSRDGDQAYRLPILLHEQNPALFATDPFVRAFDAFNPHRGYLALLDAASRPFGLSMGLFGLFALTFALTCVGLDGLARAVWPERGPRVGVVAVGLALISKAGNIGTNHLFEAMLLDRLVGFALGWCAFAALVGEPRRNWWISGVAVGLAALVHPSIGLQLALLTGAAWMVCAWWPRRTGIAVKTAFLALGAIGLAIVPGIAMNLGQGGQLMQGLPLEEFRLLSVELQGPQHMLPHLWRMPQWLAWACYPILATLALTSARRSLHLGNAPRSLGGWGLVFETPERDAGSPGSRRRDPSHPSADVRSCDSAAISGDAWKSASEAPFRLAILLVLNLLGLCLAWVAVEVAHDLRITLFQPFRMATVFRGLCLVALSGRLLALWRSGWRLDRIRAALIAVGLAGDWMFVVATLFDLSVEAMQRIRIPATPRILAAGAVLIYGLVFLSRHDTESGHIPLLAALCATVLAGALFRGRTWTWNRRRLIVAGFACWAVPIASLVVPNVSDRATPWTEALVSRCRFSAVPSDDIERLALWCRAHTSASAQFIGPPGPKTFRLWSERNLAFNRAGSPYHAEALRDWAARFRDHVGFSGSAAELVRAYQNDRHGLERRYQELSHADRADLARRQGAEYVVAAAPKSRGDLDGSLELMHAEGKYAVYRVSAPRSGDRHRLLRQAN